MSYGWWVVGWIGLSAIFIVGWSWFIDLGRPEEWKRAERDAEAAHWQRMRDSDYRGDKSRSMS